MNLRRRYMATMRDVSTTCRDILRWRVLSPTTLSTSCVSRSYSADGVYTRNHDYGLEQWEARWTRVPLDNLQTTAGCMTKAIGRRLMSRIRDPFLTDLTFWKLVTQAPLIQSGIQRYFVYLSPYPSVTGRAAYALWCVITVMWQQYGVRQWWPPWRSADGHLNSCFFSRHEEFGAV